MTFYQDYMLFKKRFGKFTSHYYVLINDDHEVSASIENLKYGSHLVHVLKYPGHRKYYDITYAIIKFQNKVKMRNKLRRE